MLPILVTPPSDAILPLSDLMCHCRIDANDCEGEREVEGLLRVATSYLDGWHGVLGRGIMPQRWSETFCGSGKHQLALMDASNIECLDAAGDVIEGVLGADYSGNYVEIEDAAGQIKISYDVQIPLERLPTVQHIVRLLVGHWYENREAATMGSFNELPMATKALIDQVKVTRL